MPEILNRIENVAKLGWYQTDLTKGTWTGSENFIRIFELEKKHEYTVEEFQALVHPDDVEDVMKYFAECLSEKKNFDMQYRCITKSGNTIHVSSRSSFAYDEKGTPISITGIKQNITEEVLRLEQLKKLLDENEHLLHLKNDILFAVAHDLKSPLGQIESILELFCTNNLDDEQLNLIGLLKESLKNANSIISNIVEMAEQNDLNTSNISKLELNSFIEKSVSRHKSLAQKKDIQLKLIQTEDKLFIKANKTEIHRCLDNLISNAIKFSYEKGKIIIGLKDLTDFVEISVQDFGMGIPENEKLNLIRPYRTEFRRAGTKGEKSSGFGLSIVNNILLKYKATLGIDSKENEGSIFTILFPKQV